MTWIQLASLRNFHAELLLKYAHPGQVPQNLLMFNMLGMAAVYNGDAAQLHNVLKEGRAFFQPSTRVLESELLTDLGTLGSLVTATCLYHVAGEDQSAVWSRLAELPRSRDAAANTLLDLLVRQHQRRDSKRPSKSAQKYPAKPSELVRKLESTPTASSLGVLTSPDHPFYQTWFEPFVLPLGMEVAREQRTEALAVVSAGGWPERRGELLYARRQKRPPFGTKVNPKDRKTWFDFDALERKGEELFAYHYVGIEWKAPLAFEADLDAYSFLASVSHDWELVREHVDSATWSWITASRSSDRCTHVVAYDPTEASAPEGAVARAAQHYGVKLVAKSIFDV